MQHSSLEISQLETVRGVRLRWRSPSGSHLSSEAVYRSLRDFEAMRDELLGTIRGSAFEAVFWEHPPLTRRRLADVYESVLLDAPRLSRMRADRQAFGEHFAASASVAQFPSLGGDATLIAPALCEDRVDYTHLSSFVRTAPLKQQHQLLSVVAKTVLQQVTERPLWLSTSGLGVGWLHVRLDSVPKYYQYAPYKHC